jgi:hypothetical protein
MVHSPPPPHITFTSHAHNAFSSTHVPILKKFSLSDNPLYPVPFPFHSNNHAPPPFPEMPNNGSKVVGYNLMDVFAQICTICNTLVGKSQSVV